jgi:hypothetical protein
MIARDPFAALEALAACPDIHDLGDLLGEARRAARELYSLKIGERRNLTPRVQAIMARVDENRVFRDVRAARALETMGELFARLM